VKIMPFDDKRDREISRAKPKAAPETVLKEVDKQLHRWGLEVVQLETGEKTLGWKIERRP
jgi:hypothetical protein